MTPETAITRTLAHALHPVHRTKVVETAALLAGCDDSEIRSALVDMIVSGKVQPSTVRSVRVSGETYGVVYVQLTQKGRMAA